MTLTSLFSVQVDGQRMVWKLYGVGDRSSPLPSPLTGKHVLQEISIGGFEPTEFAFALPRPVS